MYQEAVLHSLMGPMMERRSGAPRRLDILGLSEAREEEEVAQQRADAAKQWFLSQGVPEELIHVEAVPDGPRGSRRVDMRLLGPQESIKATRKAAENLMKRVLPTMATPATPAESTADKLFQPPPRDSPPVKEVQPAAVAPALAPAA